MLLGISHIRTSSLDRTKHSSCGFHFSFFIFIFSFLFFLIPLFDRNGQRIDIHHHHHHRPRVVFLESDTPGLLRARRRGPADAKVRARPGRRTRPRLAGLRERLSARAAQSRGFFFFAEPRLKTKKWMLVASFFRMTSFWKKAGNRLFSPFSRVLSIVA